MPSPVSEARRQAALLREALLAPGVAQIESCIPGLEETAEKLRTLDPASLRGSKRELRALQAELTRIRCLIRAGSALQEGWARILAASTGNYTPTGDPVALPNRGSVSVRG